MAEWWESSIKANAQLEAAKYKKQLEDDLRSGTPSRRAYAKQKLQELAHKEKIAKAEALPPLGEVYKPELAYNSDAESEEETNMGVANPQGHGAPCRWCKNPVRSDNATGIHAACRLEEIKQEWRNGKAPPAAAPAGLSEEQIADPSVEEARRAKAAEKEEEARRETVGEKFSALAESLGLDPGKMVADFQDGWIDRIRRAAVSAGAVPSDQERREEVSETEAKDPHPPF